MDKNTNQVVTTPAVENSDDINFSAVEQSSAIDTELLLRFANIRAEDIRSRSEVQETLTRSEDIVNHFACVGDKNSPEANLLTAVIADFLETLFTCPQNVLWALNEYPETREYIKEHLRAR